MLKAILAGHGTFLNQPIWKTVLWENDPISKELSEYLCDILCGITAYREEISTFKKMSRARVLDIKGRVLASLQDLNMWWKDWLQDNPESCQEIPTKPEITFTRDAYGVVFSTLLDFSGLGTAYTLCTYDATRILLLQLLQRILQPERQDVCLTSYNGAAGSSLVEELKNKQTPLLDISPNIEGLGP